MGFFSDIQGLAFRPKYILTFHCDPALTIGTASLWKIDGFQNIRENSVVFLTNEVADNGGEGLPHRLMSHHVTSDVIAIAFRTNFVLFRVKNDEFLEQLPKVEREFESLTVSQNGQLVFCANRTQAKYSLFHVDSGTFVWNLDR
jgi:hypothetical protein